jgi:dihydrofolate reductase
MTVSLVVALSRDLVIGKSGGLPWRLPADLRYFRELTWGKPILMGRKTYESIGRPLPGRRNIVITGQPHFSAPGCELVSDPEAAMQLCAEAPEIMVIGGAKLFTYFLPKARRIYLTEVDANVEGDVYFPVDPRAGFREVRRIEREPDTENPYRLIFSALEKIDGRQ